MTREELYNAHMQLYREWRRLNPVPGVEPHERRPWARLTDRSSTGFDVWLHDDAGGALFKDRRIAHITEDLRSVYWYGPRVWEPMFARPFTGKGWLMKMIEALSLAANTCLAEEIAKAKERT